MECLWAAGALDVTVTPDQMKKGRPGVVMSVQATPNDADRLEAILFPNADVGSTPNVSYANRACPSSHEVKTAWGAVAGKVAYLPDGCHDLRLSTKLADRSRWIGA